MNFSASSFSINISITVISSHFFLNILTNVHSASLSTEMYFEHLLFFSALTVNVLCTGKIVPNETWSLCLRKDDAEREGVSYSEAFLKSKCKTDPTFSSRILFICWAFLTAGKLLRIRDHSGSVKSVSFPAGL